MKKKLTLCILFTLSILYNLFSQGSYKIDSDGNISEFKLQSQFNNFCQVDFDFNKAYNCNSISQSILIDIGNTGTGKFHLFLEKKTTFEITRCYKSGSSFQIVLKNSFGTEFKGALFLNTQNSVDKFYFQSVSDNTGFMLY